MAHTRSFARSRTLKAIATLCVLCALAFALGQETAAFRAAQMRAAVATAPPAHAAPLPAIPTAVAHGETHSPSASPAQELAVSVNQPSSGNGHAPKHGKKKHGSKHDAAGDSSHGGIVHHGGHASGGGHSGGSSKRGH